MEPPAEELGTRELTVVGYPYEIDYQVEADEGRIIHIRHTNRLPWRGND